jgi:hypothetical protein
VRKISNKPLLPLKACGSHVRTFSLHFTHTALVLSLSVRRSRPVIRDDLARNAKHEIMAKAAYP